MRYAAARHNVEDAEEEVQLGGLTRNALQRLFVAELLLDFEGLRKGDEWQDEPQRELEAEHHENDVGCKKKQCIKDVRGSATNKDSERHDAHFLVRFGIARIIAVENRFCVKRQWDCVIN